MKLFSILTESKKSDVKKELLSKFPEAEMYIDRAINSDPTGFKYMDYIKRSFIDLYPISKSWGNEESLVEYFDDISWFENNYKRLSIDDIDSIYEDAKADNASQKMLRSIVSINPNKIRDINSWDIRTLKYVRDYVNSKKTRKQMEKEAKEGADLVYESPNKKVLVFKVKTHAAACYYGRNTKWCVTTAGQPGHFQRETQDYDMYFVVDRTGEREKLAVQKPKDRRKSNFLKVWNEKDVEKGPNHLYDLYPEVHDVFVGDSMNETIKFLKSLTTDNLGKYRWDYPDDLITDMYLAGSTEEGNLRIIIEITFSDKSFWEMYDINEYDSTLIQTVYSPYNSWDFWDTYTIKEDFEEGYLWNYATNEQQEEISRLCQILFPSYLVQLKQNTLDEMPKEFNQLVEKTFPRKIDSMVYEYTASKNNEAEHNVRDGLESEYCDIFKEYNGKVMSCFYRYAFNVNDLIRLLEDYKGGDVFDSLRAYVNRVSDAPYEISDWAYQGGGSSDEYNGMENEFDSLINAMQESVDSSEDVEDITRKTEEYNNFNKFLEKNKITVGDWNTLPSDNNFSFRINTIDFKEGKVDLQIKSNDTGNMKEYFPTYEEFTSLLYNYQLFR